MSQKKDDVVGKGANDAGQKSQEVPQHKRLAQGVPNTGVGGGKGVQQKH